MRKTAASAAFLILLGGACFAQDWAGDSGGGSQSGRSQAKTVAPGVEIEGFVFDVDLKLEEFDGFEWDGTAITGEATQDTDKNAEYRTHRSYYGIRGFVEINPVKEAAVKFFIRCGVIREVYHAEHDSGSYFRDTDEDPETDTVYFRNGTLFGAGADATLKFAEFRIGVHGGVGYDHLSYRNQEWFLARTKGTITVFTADIGLSVGYSLGFITPRIGLGALIYSAAGNYREIWRNNDRNDKYDAEYAAVTPVVVTVGADLEAGANVIASFDLVLFGQYGLQVSAGIRF